MTKANTLPDKGPGEIKDTRNIPKQNKGNIQHAGNQYQISNFVPRMTLQKAVNYQEAVEKPVPQQISGKTRNLYRIHIEYYKWKEPHCGEWKTCIS